MDIVPTEDPEEAALERFPHIIRDICLFWDYHDIDLFFNKLLILDRPDREGFPNTVVAEIMFLQRLHQVIIEEKLIAKKTDFFGKIL